MRFICSFILVPVVCFFAMIVYLISVRLGFFDLVQIPPEYSVKFSINAKKQVGLFFKIGDCKPSVKNVNDQRWRLQWCIFYFKLTVCLRGLKIFVEIVHFFFKIANYLFNWIWMIVLISLFKKEEEKTTFFNWK